MNCIHGNRDRSRQELDTVPLLAWRPFGRLCRFWKPKIVRAERVFHADSCRIPLMDRNPHADQ